MEAGSLSAGYLLPDGEEIVSEAVADEVHIAQGRDIEPWLSDGKRVMSGRNLKVVLTRRALYLIDYGYKGFFRTLSKYREHLKGGLKRDTVEYQGAAMVSRNVYMIPLSSIEAVSFSQADGLSRRYRVHVETEETRPWGMVILGIILFLAGMIVPFEVHSTGALAGGALLSLIGLILAIRSARKRFDVERSVDMRKIDLMEHASQTTLKLLVRYATPKQARTVHGPDGSRLEVMYDVGLYTITLEAYHENSEGLRALAKKLPLPTPAFDQAASPSNGA